jgi:hypothetical protein
MKSYKPERLRKGSRKAANLPASSISDGLLIVLQPLSGGGLITDSAHHAT